MCAAPFSLYVLEGQAVTGDTARPPDRSASLTEPRGPRAQWSAPPGLILVAVLVFALPLQTWPRLAGSQLCSYLGGMCMGRGVYQPAVIWACWEHCWTASGGLGATVLPHVACWHSMCEGTALGVSVGTAQ